VDPWGPGVSAGRGPCRMGWTLTVIDPPNLHAWRRCEFAWRTPVEPGRYTLLARARDARGSAQPDGHDPKFGTYVISHPLPIEVFVGEQRSRRPVGANAGCQFEDDRLEVHRGLLLGVRGRRSRLRRRATRPLPAFLRIRKFFYLGLELVREPRYKSDRSASVGTGTADRSVDCAAVGSPIRAHHPVTRHRQRHGSDWKGLPEFDHEHPGEPVSPCLS
jgi:hypothetical protein